MTGVTAALLIVFGCYSAIAVYLAWEANNEIDLDNLTDDGPDDLDRWLAQTPVAPVDDWSAWEREVAT